MDVSIRPEVTRILGDLKAGESGNAALTERLLELLYPELRSLAAALLRRERVDHTLQPTALVHEAYLKLVDQVTGEWQDRAHFLGVSARAMRQILVDHARRRNAAKRGGGRHRVTLDEGLSSGHDPEYEILALDDALSKFAQLDERGAKVAELRIFAGMTVKEIAEALGVSPRTVDGDWATARMWLAREIRGPEGG